MIKFRSFQMFLILVIPFTAVTQHRFFITVRVGDEATLLCEDVRDLQDKCSSITWVFKYLTKGPTVTLFEGGQITREAAAKSDRLSVIEKCSLVIKKVTYDDAGRYNCRQFISGQLDAYSDVYLTVNYRDNGATTTKQTTKVIKATTRPTTTTDSAAGETSPNEGDNVTPTTPTTQTTKTPTKATEATTRPPPTTDPTAAETSRNTNLPAILISVGVVLAALSIIIVAVIRWKRAEGNDIKVDDNTADPPDGVSYASIRYKKKTKSKTRVQDEDDTVTYSTLNTSSTSAGASTDPRKLYASINKTKA